MSLTIRTRASWGAQAERASSSDPVTKVGRSARVNFVIHHTVTGRGSAQSAVPGILRSIQSTHFGRGFNDIGYNFLIDAWGGVWMGRGLDKRAAAVGGANTVNISAAYIGNNDPTNAAEQAFIDLKAYVDAQIGRKLGVKGHRDFNSTACPGDKLYSWLRAGMKSPIPPNPWDDVKAVQTRLNKWGAKPPLDVDGDYGPLTTAAMKAFQSAQALPVTGKPDELSWAILSTEPPTTPAPPVEEPDPPVEEPEPPVEEPDPPVEEPDPPVEEPEEPGEPDTPPGNVWALVGAGVAAIVAFVWYWLSHLGS